MDNDIAILHLQQAGLTKADINQLACMGYFTAPASKGHHLAKEGGLVEHSINVKTHLVNMTAALGVTWPRAESPALVGMLHDVVKCKCYRLRADGSGYDYKQPEYPGHGVASVMIIAVELGIYLYPEEAAAITWHMGAFGLAGRELAEFDAALARWPRHIIATHTADWYAARVVESGDWSAEREVPHA